MAISLSSLQRSSDHKKPPRIILHGCQGIGKSTFGSQGESPVFIQCEDGLSALDVPAFPLAKTFGDVMDALNSLLSESHDFKTLVIDSLDWLEPLVYAHTCETNKWDNIESPGYGKGYIAAANVWMQYIDGINQLRDEVGMTIVQIAHTEIKKFQSPDSESYNRYGIKLRDATASKLMEHSDFVLFANYIVSITGTKISKKTGDISGVARGDGVGTRMIYTSERPSHVAKSRYRMPDSVLVIDERWSSVWGAIWDAMAGGSSG